MQDHGAHGESVAGERSPVGSPAGPCWRRPPVVGRCALPPGGLVPLTVATHNGSFHADDVLAFALVRAFLDPDATVVRTRDPVVLAQADVVVDVGGEFDPGRRRFDHHQASYEGPRSSAGMVLDWLQAEGRLDEDLAVLLRERIVDYVDDVDNGRVEPLPHVPCFANIVAGYTRGARTLADFDARFLDAAAMAGAVVAGLVAEHEECRQARDIVVGAMAAAAEAGSNVLELPRYLRWKPIYFDNGGAAHGTEFVIMPGLDGSWRVVCIPPAEGSFDQKRPLPAGWAGLVDEALEAACGVPGARFCHKNRFIAVFDSRAHLLEALGRAGLLRGA
ncbi:MAG: MYG1 family protein [Deltaproteobacteria bacterium]|nr:MAG: MYG1 family protein [Deltaproteobacteria bacterium]